MHSICDVAGWHRPRVSPGYSTYMKKIQTTHRTQSVRRGSRRKRKSPGSWRMIWIWRKKSSFETLWKVLWCFNRLCFLLPPGVCGWTPWICVGGIVEDNVRFITTPLTCILARVSPIVFNRVDSCPDASLSVSTDSWVCPLGALFFFLVIIFSLSLVGGTGDSFSYVEHAVVQHRIASLHSKSTCARSAVDRQHSHFSIFSLRDLALRSSVIVRSACLQPSRLPDASILRSLRNALLLWQPSFTDKVCP